MYKNSSDHSLGTQACVDGYEFHMEGNEWNVISEVSLIQSTIGDLGIFRSLGEYYAQI